MLDVPLQVRGASPLLLASYPARCNKGETPRMMKLAVCEQEYIISTATSVEVAF